MHALWNLISKRRSSTLAFFFVATVSSTLVVAPLLVLYRHLLPTIPPSVWALIAATGSAQAIYYYGLSGAYRWGDMSLAYPLARALPVVAVAAISLLLGRGEALHPMGLLGMGLISVGCIILPLPHFRRLRPQDYMGLVYLMAIVAATGTVAYTVLDDTILRQLRGFAPGSLSKTEITLFYIALQTTSSALMIGLATLFSAPERKQLATLVGDRVQLAWGALTGLAIMATYGLVLISMAHVRDVSYVAAFRQLSIPIGALFGLTLQREAAHRPKLIGIAIISIGLILVATG